MLLPIFIGIHCTCTAFAPPPPRPHPPACLLICPLAGWTHCMLHGSSSASSQRRSRVTRCGLRWAAWSRPPRLTYIKLGAPRRTRTPQTRFVRFEETKEASLWPRRRCKDFGGIAGRLATLWLII